MLKTIIKRSFSVSSVNRSVFTKISQVQTLRTPVRSFSSMQNNKFLRTGIYSTPTIHLNYGNNNTSNLRNNKVRHYSTGNEGLIETLTGLSATTVTGGITATALAGTGIWLATRYKVARANEYIVRTGLFIKDIDISKKAFLLPYHTMTYINLEPSTYHCLIEEAMSHERISFNMPTVFTVGPKDDIEALKIYSKLLQQSSS